MQSTLDRIVGARFDPRVSRRNLAYFYAAATELNFTRAANLLGIAQPSLSQGIGLLEDAVGYPLFERTRKSVRLTDPGRELLPAAEHFLNQCLDLDDWLSTRATGGTVDLRIAGVSTLTADWLPTIVGEFERSEPNIAVRLTDGINDEIVNAVRAGSIDIGVVSTVGDPNELRTQLLFKDRYALVVNRSHRLARRKSVKWTELEEVDLAAFELEGSIYGDIRHTFREVGVYFQPRERVKYRNTLIGLVRHRHLATVLPEQSTRKHLTPELRVIPLTDPVVERPYYLVTRKDRFSKPGLSRLEQHLARDLAGEG